MSYANLSRLTRRVTPRLSTAVTLGLVAVVLQGCAAVALPLIGAGLGTLSGAGTGYVLDSITYKTFSVPLAGVTLATVMTLHHMDMQLVSNEATESGRLLVARAGNRTVDIELDQLTSRTTRMRVVVTRQLVIRDKATAAEVILQTDRVLTEHPHLAIAEPKPALALVPAATPPMVAPSRSAATGTQPKTQPARARR